MYWDDIWIVYDSPFLVVNMYVFLVLVWQRYRNSQFTSAFYTIYLIECVIRYAGYAVVRARSVGNARKLSNLDDTQLLCTSRPCLLLVDSKLGS